MLANLGLYARVFEDIQAQLKSARKSIEKARKEAPATQKKLIKRGEKLLDQVTKMVKQSGVPTSKDFDKQVDRLRKALKDLRKRAR